MAICGECEHKNKCSLYLYMQAGQGTQECPARTRERELLKTKQNNASPTSQVCIDRCEVDIHADCQPPKKDPHPPSDPLKKLSPEELAEVEPPSDDTIRAALDKGEQEAFGPKPKDSCDKLKQHKECCKCKGRWVAIYEHLGGERVAFTHIDATHAQIDLIGAAPQLLQALEAAEWGGRTNDDEACPVCGNESRIGHTQDCILNNALKLAHGEKP